MATPENAQVKPVEPIKTSFVKEQPASQPQPEKEEKRLGTPELLVRIYEVEVYIGKTLKDLNDTLSRIEKQGLVKPATTPTQTVSASPTPTIPTPSTQTMPAPDAKLQKITAAFPEELLKLITINGEENNMFYIIKPREFLGSENFAKIAGAVRAMGGEYVSQGRASHFRISKA